MRIVSLLPSTTEILFALGLGDQVVGVTHECDYPPEAAALAQVTSSALPEPGNSAQIDRHVRESVHSGSSLYNLDSELLEELRPDLIITQELCQVCAVSYEIVDRAAKRLSSDPRVVSLEPSSLDDVFANIVTIGELTHSQTAARELVKQLQSRLHALPDAHPRHATRAHPRTLVLEWTDPPMSGGHWTPGLVEMAGGLPVLCNPGKNSAVVSWQAILEESPDVVLIAPCGFNLKTTLRAIDDLQATPEFLQLRAYREGRVYAIDGNAFVNRPGPRLVETAEIFAACIHAGAHDTVGDDRFVRYLKDA
ncbi:MAG: cobalamin-binding protein [Candidatus Eremiobacteraeota bacterium]|nr:cobalamin-binding protein [Candidatus Eremiobacteraeota bacterium]